MATILSIDDEPDASKVRRLLLESEGYEVIDAATGQAGIRLFQSHKVDLVMVDYWMSGLNGIDVVRQIKAINPSVPVIMFSGYAELPGEAGLADRWIMKGRSTQELLDAIAAFTRR
jgi:CheY-like chemotaxis protein